MLEGAIVLEGNVRRRLLLLSTLRPPQKRPQKRHLKHQRTPP